MAQKIHILLEDDIDGGEASETVAFALDGSSYEIDLNDTNAAGLRDAMASYVGHARKVTGGRGRTKKASTAAAAATNGSSAREIREWARSNGHEVPERGRIPADIRDAFESAN